MIVTIEHLEQAIRRMEREVVELEAEIAYHQNRIRDLELGPVAPDDSERADWFDQHQLDELPF